MALCAVLDAGCAAVDADVHLAPLYSQVSTAGGGTRAEGLFGAWRITRDEAQGFVRRHQFSPLFAYKYRGDGKGTTYFLPPLGLHLESPEHTTSLLVPFYVYGSDRVAAHPETRDYRLYVFPFLILTRRNQDTELGIFPLFARLDHFLIYEEFAFVLFPFYVTTERQGQRSEYFLWPFFGRTSGGGKRALRFWPLIGHSVWEGRYDRWFFLWPFFHVQRNYLAGGAEEPEKKLWFFPLVGRTTRGSYVGWTVLWPFFGYARDPRGDFLAVDAPWPLVRFQRGGRHTFGTERKRVWPFYGYLNADGLKHTSYLWPFIQLREEGYLSSQRKSAYVIPFFQNWDRLDKQTGEVSGYTLFWPYFQQERNLRGRDRTSVGVLLPIGRSAYVDQLFGWAWELWEVVDTERGTSERSWGGLWLREDDAWEQRRSLAGLWAQRTYVDDPGADEPGRITETSLLFGLLRWRTSDAKGRELLAPALPGPGWPVERAGPTLPPVPYNL